MSLFGVKILGTGSYVPEKILTNHDLEKIVDTSDEWITERTGIKERHIAAEDEPTSELAEKASIKAMEVAGITAEQIDMIIFATLTPDTHMPNCGCQLQARLGAVNAAAFSMEVACSGFVYALKIANDMIACGSFKHILVVAAEELSKVTDWTDRNTCVLFGDGAGAVVLGQAPIEENMIFASSLKANGNYAESLYIPAGGTKQALTEEAIANHDHCIKMSGKEIYKLAVESMTQSCKDVVEASNLTLDDINWLVPHQANERIITAIGKRLNLDNNRVFINVNKYGNTSAASIPIALDELVRSGKLNSGDNILLTAFGGGLTWGAQLIKWK